MATFTKTIANGVNVFGGGPSTKFGQATFPYTAVFGTSKWGEGTNKVEVNFTKVISNSQPSDSDLAYAFSITKSIDLGSAVVTHDMASQTLQNGDWFYVFTSDTSAGESRDFATWVAGTDPDVTFVCQAAQGTSWSEA